MSLTLILVRHAKSDWGDASLADHDRPLNPRGRRAAGRIGEWLAERGHVPDLALVSTAKRAAQTWRGMAETLGGSVEMTRLTDLYNATPETILASLEGIEARRVLVIAHNPGMAALAQWLVETTPDRVEFHRFPTCATLVLSIPRDSWGEMGARCAQVEDFAVPRDLTE